MSKKYIEKYLLSKIKMASVCDDTTIFGELECSSEDFFTILASPLYLDYLAESVLELITDYADVDSVLPEATEEFFSCIDIDSALQESIIYQ